MAGRFLRRSPYQPRNAKIQGVNPFIPTDHVQLDLEMALLFAQAPRVPDAVRASIIRDYVPRNHHYQQVRNIVNFFDTVLQGVPGEPLEIRVPVLIRWGESDAVYPVFGAESLRKRLPGSRLVTLPETGHLPMVERATETGKLLVQFLREDTRPGSPPHRQDPQPLHGNPQRPSSPARP